VANLELCQMSAGGIAAAVRARKLSPVEVVQNTLARIGEVNPSLNCFCFIYPEEALAAAREAEAAVMRGDSLGPLHGVPIAFKDMTPTKGKRTTLGSYAFEHWIPDRDAAIVDRLTGAGAITVGKTTTSELAFSYITETKLWGATRNPWNLGHTPGGSSGGSAAAVASGCVPIAEGCDMGGSIRLPASFCGIVGLKPSFGRIPFDILPSQFDPYCHFGPLAWTAGDAALFLNAAQGPDDRDFSSLPAIPAVDLPESADVKGLRLALSIDLGYNAVDPEVAANTHQVAENLRSLGATVEEVEIGWTREINDAIGLQWDVYTALIIGDRIEQFRDRMDPGITAAVKRGLKVKALDFKRVDLIRTEQWRAVAPIFARYDALLCPTTSRPAPEIGVREADFGHDDATGRYYHFEMTSPFNMLGALPALSVPSGVTSRGLPTGIQIVGRRYDDAAVLRIGAALERELGWLARRPTI
jgi:Asp-tRNA(Asn)/Glu-tRNA(Gln) amidotransferase A subunit family amidase